MSQLQGAAAFPPIGSQDDNIVFLAVVSLLSARKFLLPGECFNGDDDTGVTGPTVGPASLYDSVPPINGEPTR